jgi:AraC-like DNA-binding protein
MLRPYNRVLRRYAQIPGEVLDAYDALEPDERVPIATMLELLRGTVALTGDEDIGLKAAREIVAGDYGVIEYLLNSAGTLRESIELVGRYLPLVNDALEFSFFVEGERATIKLDSRIALPRAAADFQSAAFIVSTFQRSPELVDPEYRALFIHPAPANLDEYERTFAPGEVVFGAEFNGFVFDSRRLGESQTAADPRLHDVLRKYADLLLADLPKPESLTDKVRSLVGQKLATGEPNADSTARALHMSRRTLARKLEQEGTSFKELLDDTRKRLALRYVVSHEVGLTEIAFLLGFSHTGPFFRAFKRWTGSTPLEYRRGRRA